MFVEKGHKKALTSAVNWTILLTTMPLKHMFKKNLKPIISKCPLVAFITMVLSEMNLK